MKTATLALIAGTHFVAGVTAASAQDGKINDPNNPAPNYGTMAPAGSTNVPSKINDGNNPAPNYGGSTAEAPKAKASKYTTHTHAHHSKKANHS